MTLQIFAGQGVRVITSGKYGVVRETNDSERHAIMAENEGKEPENQRPVPPRKAVVQFQSTFGLYLYEELGPAQMTTEEFEELQTKIETYPEQRGSRTLIPVNSLESLNLHADYKVFTGKVDVKVRSRMVMKIETTMDNGLVVTGGKCEHGVYITSREQYENGAKYCSVCHPYVILAKSGIEFKA